MIKYLLLLSVVVSCGVATSKPTETTPIEVYPAPTCTAVRDEEAKGVEINCGEESVWVYDGTPGMQGPPGTAGSPGESGQDGNMGVEGPPGPIASPLPLPAGCTLSRHDVTCVKGKTKYKAYIICGESEEFIGDRTINGC